MKKKISIILILLLSILLGIFLYFHCPKTIEKEPLQEIIPVVEKEETVNYEEIINNLKNTYNNPEIIAVIRIPNVLEEAIAQTSDNDYYLHYDLYKNQNIVGASFLDYRNKIREDKKLLIYGHSDPEGQLPFVKLTNYNKKEFLKENPYIYLLDKDGERKYEVFSSYIETSDFDYVNLNSFNGLSYKEHLEKLKKKSFVSTKVSLEEDSRVLILQTCSFDSRIQAKTKYQIVVAKEI